MYNFLILVVSFLSLINISVQHFNPIYIACLQSKSCNHTGFHECGRDDNNFDVRMFLDECDRIEYNCDNKKEYYKTKIEECQTNPDNSTNTANENLPTTEKNITKLSYTSTSFSTLISRNSTHNLLTTSLQSTNASITSELLSTIVAFTTNTTLKSELTTKSSITTEESTTLQLISNMSSTYVSPITNISKTTDRSISTNSLLTSLEPKRIEKLTTVQLNTPMELTTDKSTTVWSSINEPSTFMVPTTEKSTTVQLSANTSSTSMDPTTTVRLPTNGPSTSMNRTTNSSNIRDISTKVKLTSNESTTATNSITRKDSTPNLTNVSSTTSSSLTELISTVRFTTNGSSTFINPTRDSSETRYLPTKVQLTSIESTTKTNSTTNNDLTSLITASLTVTLATNASVPLGVSTTTTSIRATTTSPTLPISTILTTFPSSQLADTNASNGTGIQNDCSRTSTLLSTTSPFTTTKANLSNTSANTGLATLITKKHITNNNSAEKITENLNNTPSYNIISMETTTIKSTTVIDKPNAEIASTMKIDLNQKIFNTSTSVSETDLIQDVIKGKDTVISKYMEIENTTQAVTTSQSTRPTCITYPARCNRPVTWDTTSEGETRDFFQILKDKFGGRAIHLKDTTHYKFETARRFTARFDKSFFRGPHNES